MTSYFLGCDMGAEPAVSSQTTMSSFQQAVILERDVALESSSEKLAVTDAVLLLAFTPKTILPQSGQISLKVPARYIVSSQRVPFQYSSESVLSFDSTATFESHAGEDFIVLSTEFDASSGSLTIIY